MTRSTVVAVRWTARLSGLLLLALVVVFAIGEGGPPNVLDQPRPVQLQFAGMFLMLAGFLIGWRWEAAGGITAVAGFALFLAIEIATNGGPPGGAIPLFLIPGVLLLISTGLAYTLRRSVGR
jgi:hypothetical protein